MNFYKRHIGDYIKDAGHLTLLEHGIYARLLDVYYTREAGIPEDKAARLIGARSKDELQALANVLDEFFTLVDGTWTQGRCEEEISNASEKAEKNRENGAKGGRPRKAQTDSETGENPDGYGSGNHVGSENNLSQTPDSRLQTEFKEAAGDSTEVGAARVGEICKLLRKAGINTGPAALERHTWPKNPKATDDLIETAILIAKQHKPNSTFSVNYLRPIIEDLLAVPVSAPPKKDWI